MANLDRKASQATGAASFSLVGDPIVLPRAVEGPAVDAVLRSLQTTILADQTVLVDAHDVDAVSTLGLQVLAAGKLSAERRGLRFQILHPSTAFNLICKDVGLSSHFALEE
jgi:anti-anti-sigma regulatory factor